MVLILGNPAAVDLRAAGLRHARGIWNNCAKLMLASGLVLSYGYFIEAVMAVYAGDKYELGVQAQPLGWARRRMCTGH